MWRPPAARRLAASLSGRQTLRNVAAHYAAHYFPRPPPWPVERAFGRLRDRFKFIWSLGLPPVPSPGLLNLHGHLCHAGYRLWAMAMAIRISSRLRRDPAGDKLMTLPLASDNLMTLPLAGGAGRDHRRAVRGEWLLCGFSPEVLDDARRRRTIPGGIAEGAPRLGPRRRLRGRRCAGPPPPAARIVEVGCSPVVGGRARACPPPT